MWIMKLFRHSNAQEVKNYENYDFGFSRKENLGTMYNLSLKEGVRYYLQLLFTKSP